MEFKTDLPFREPDGGFYADLKHIVVVDHQPGVSFGDAVLVPGFSALREEVGNDRFDLFYGPRLSLAGRGDLGHDFLARFPGTHVPLLGNRGHVYSLGSLAIDRFLRASAWQGGVLSDGTDEIFSIEETPRAHLWPWRYPEPALSTIIPAAERKLVSEARLQTFSDDVLSSGDPIKLIETAWSPHTRSRHEVAQGDQMRQCLQEHKRNLPLLFELEDTLAHLYWTREHPCVGQGFYRGCYLELYLMELSEIRNTEIAQTGRVLQELCTLIERGFAPVVVNEYGANVDGTHRQTASWLWNLLHGLTVQDLHLDSSTIHEHIARFMNAYKEQMGPVTVREVLRIFAELIDDPVSCIVLAQKILPMTHVHPQIRQLPVLFLREASWPTVRYREYLGGERAVRVDPLIYERMEANPSLVLPAHGQGPYHLTDRELVYWFDVLSINRMP
ncbi:hypothetical protein HQ487_03485 [Candidatus Uhrbacteria bacterium]|nr:hypothetical protein [Candidatus Uhrbacteria bacterium]